MLVHHLAFVNFDARDGGAQAKPALGVVADPAHFRDALDVHEHQGFAHPITHLDQQVGAAAKDPRVVTAGRQQLDCLIDRGGSLVTECVQSKPSWAASSPLGFPKPPRPTEVAGRQTGREIILMIDTAEAARWKALPRHFRAPSTRQTPTSAWNRSSIRSSAASIPTASLTNPSEIPSRRRC